jgi:hypothetical protein
MSSFLLVVSLELNAVAVVVQLPASLAVSTASTAGRGNYWYTPKAHYWVVPAVPAVLAGESLVVVEAAAVVQNMALGVVAPVLTEDDLPRNGERCAPGC